MGAIEFPSGDVGVAADSESTQNPRSSATSGDLQMEGLPDQRPRHARRGRVHLLLQRVLPNGFHRSIPAGRPEPFQVADVVLSRSEASMSFAGL